MAEDLGVITPEVEALRDAFGFPGMAILQFAFGSDAHGNDFLPHNYPKHKVVYTGTHDNDTVVGWWNAGVGDSTRTAAEVERERERALAYVGGDGSEIHWDFVRTLLVSVADTAIVPLQDVLGTGSRGAHEPARPRRRQLALALRGGGPDAGAARRAAGDHRRLGPLPARRSERDAERAVRRAYDCPTDRRRNARTASR